MPRVFKPSSDTAFARAVCTELNGISRFQGIHVTCVAPCKSGCYELCVGGDQELPSIYVSSHGEDEVPLNEIDGLLALVCCSKHVAEYKSTLGGLLIGPDHDNLDHPAGSPTSMVHFGSQDSKNTDHTFSFSVSSQASEPPSVDPEDVSSTRQLQIFSDGRREVYPVGKAAASPAPSLAVSSPVDHDTAAFDTPTREPSRLESRNAADPITPSARLPLSPNEPRRTNRNRSETRTRTPSPGHSRRLSNYGRSAWATMRGDVSYERPPGCNQKKVLELIREPLQYTDARTWNKPGFVYVVRDPELKLVKIGFTTECISDRIRSIGSQCRASSKQWQIEHEDQNIPILAYRRLERLVHMDLAPHRWFFLCECGLAKRNGSRPTEHQEWFDVSPEIAIKTIKLWRSFLLKHPYGPPLRDTRMQLKEPWIHRVNKCKEMDCNEKHEDHETRLNRWRKFLHLQELCEPTRVSKQEGTDASMTKIKSEPVEEDPHEPTRVPKQDETEALKTTIKSEPVEEDPVTIFMNLPQKALEDLPIPSIEPATVADTPVLAPEISVDLGEGAQAPNVHGHAAPSQITPSSGEAAPSDLASAEDQPKAEMQFEDSKRHRIAAHNVDATSKVVHHGEKLLLNLLAALNHKRPAIPERTIMEDLTALRWPLGCAVVFALHTPYVPPLLSAMLWTIFLPSLVAELRGWTL